MGSIAYAMSQTNGYGTTDRNPAAGATNHVRNLVDEEEPLLNGGVDGPRNRKGVVTRMRKAAKEEIKRDWADVVLIACYIITGLLDSASISIWGSFVSMQTGESHHLSTKARAAQITDPFLFFLFSLLGNTVYIGLGLAAPTQSNRWIKSGTSLGCFCIGSLFFSRFHRFFSPKRRATLFASFALQSALCTAAAGIVTWGPGGYGPNDITWDVLVPIALVAFQACGQAVTSRALRYNALTSVVLTSIYCDLFSDVELFRVDNPERNRRLGAPLMLLVGAVAGGLFAHSDIGVAGALWAASLLKVLIVFVWIVWPGEDAEE